MSLATNQNLKSLDYSDDNQTELILQSLSEGICRIDANGEIIFSNPSAARMLGRKDTTKLIGKDYRKVFFLAEKVADDAMIDPILFALIDGETSHVNTETFYKEDGQEFLVEYVCVPIFEGESVIGAVISFEDVTERRDVEIALTKARDAALEAAEVKATFLANMSHEIRTPLNGIVGTTSLLNDTELTGEQRHYVKMLKTSTNLLLHIVNDILDYSKIEAGKFQREEIGIDIYEVVNEITDVFLPIAKKKNLKLSFDIQEDVPKNLKGDVNKIRQVLNNFLSNAFKFTKEGEIFLQVNLEEEIQDEIVLKFAVADSGIGIDEETQKLLFQPFVQADASTTRRFGGTGLGLAICKNLVEIMDGNIGIESRLSEGATFWFTARFGSFTPNSLDNQPNNVELEEKIFDKKQINKQDIKILIVENNLINREVTQKVLEQLGLKSETAENGLEAVKICSKEVFDLVFMDCQMPKMDGFEATQKIRELKNYNSDLIKIIALTASSTLDERQECFDAGMDDYLSKPFTKEDLIHIFDKYFDFETGEINLDLETNIIQHSFANIIESKTLQNFLEIEASGEENFISELLDLFLMHTDEKMPEIKKAFSEQNSEVIRQIAHNLKGSSGNTGLMDLSKLFAELEEKLKIEDWDIIGKKLEEVFEQIEIIKETVMEK